MMILVKALVIVFLFAAAIPLGVSLVGFYTHILFNALLDGWNLAGALLQ